MADISHTNKSITEMSDEELRNLINKIRGSRITASSNITKSRNKKTTNDLNKFSLEDLGTLKGLLEDLDE